MANAPIGLVLRHLRQVAHVQAASGATDRQLLDQFVNWGEEAAFTLLLQRHGPMVFGVCRRLLHNEHDAEDVYQATFLLLARKASGIRKRESLSSWLYGVAYRLALRMKAQAASRQTRERRSVLRKQAAQASFFKVAWRELEALLDEALQTLPEKYRVVLVLCYLQSKTQEQAARHLGCALGTVRSRLARGREMLRARLTQRGLALSAGAFVTVLATANPATAVPPLLVHATLRAAATGMGAAAAGVSPRVAALVQGGLNAMVATHTKFMTALLLAFGLVVGGVATLARQATARQEPGAVRGTAQVAPRPEASPPAVLAPETDNAEKQKARTVIGHVVDTAGKPLARAQVAILGLPKSRNHARVELVAANALARTQTDKDGRFRLVVPSAALMLQEKLYVLAGLAGHGLAWEPLATDPAGKETLLRLPPERIIRGRLLDLQGQAAVGVRIRVNWLGSVSPGGVSTRLGDHLKNDFPLWPGPATTGPDGRFEIHGLNPTLEGYLHIESERFALQWVALRRDKDQRVQEVNMSLAPAQIIEGLVTAADSGKPVPFARLSVNADNNVDSPRAMGPGTSGQADAQGRFRLNPPPGKLFTVHAEAPATQPYLRMEKNLQMASGGHATHH
jgi:RNA polymerase sigma factor (sigma-70 family)